MARLEVTRRDRTTRNAIRIDHQPGTYTGDDSRTIRIQATIVSFDGNVIEVINLSDGNAVKRYRVEPDVNIPIVGRTTRVTIELLQLNRSGDRRVKAIYR